MTLLLCARPAHAEEWESMDLSMLEQGAEGLTKDVRGWIRELAEGEDLRFGEIIDHLREAALREAGGVLRSGVLFLGVLCLNGVLRQTGNGERSAAPLSGGLAASVLLELLSGCVTEAGETVEKVSGVTRTVSPVLVSLLLSTGAQGASESMTALSALVQSLTDPLLTAIVPMLCCTGAALSAAGGMQEKLKLRKLAKVFTDLAGWICGGLLTAFLCAGRLSGSMATVRDSVALRSAGYAVDNLFPVVGGQMKEALGAAAGSVVVIRNAVGVVCAVILLWMGAVMSMKLILSCILCRVLCALAEPMGTALISDMTDGFLRAFRGLLACVWTSAVMAVIWVGTAITCGRQIMALIS